jgi:hypothetical protein
LGKGLGFGACTLYLLFLLAIAAIETRFWNV